MKIVLLSLTAIFTFSGIAMAKGTTKRKPTSDVQCQETALEATKFIDKLGWGEVASEPLKIISESRSQQFETFQIKSTVSGYIYQVKILQDSKSESCIILSIDSHH